jgi:chromosome partitioning protein
VPLIGRRRRDRNAAEAPREPVPEFGDGVEAVPQDGAVPAERVPYDVEDAEPRHAARPEPEEPVISPVFGNRGSEPRHAARPEAEVALGGVSGEGAGGDAEPATPGRAADVTAAPPATREEAVTRLETAGPDRDLETAHDADVDLELGSQSRPPQLPAMPSPEVEELKGGGVGALRPLPRVVAVANQKGGVGKTTTTVNLGAALADLGYRVLVVDLDPQGNATTGLGIDARNFEHSMYDVIMRDTPLEDCIEPTSVRNLFVAPATIDLAGVEIELVPAFSRELRVRRAVESVAEEFDFVLIDCPPSLGLITINGLAAASEVLVPIQCEYYALEGLGQLLRNVHLVASNLNDRLEVSAIVLTMYDARTRLAVDVASEVRQHFGEKVCRNVIPRTVRLSEAPSFGQPITVFDPASRGAVAYRELAKEVSNGAPKRAG